MSRRTPIRFSFLSLGFVFWGFASLISCSPPPNITLSFRANIQGQTLDCSKQYKAVGASKATFRPHDLRLYVHNVRLITTAGEEVPMELVPDGRWQSRSVALLDFEDKTGTCTYGTPETNMRIQGILPEGEYKGLRFTMGVPFAENHQNAFEASAPLNVTSMFWSWRAGYKFFRLDGFTDHSEKQISYRFHIGSIACQSDEQQRVSSCTYPNRPEIQLDDFRPGQHTIVLNLDQFLAQETIDQPPPEGQRHNGCMSGNNEPGCVTAFSRIGLRYKQATSQPRPQFLFTLEDKTN